MNDALRKGYSAPKVSTTPQPIREGYVAPKPPPAAVPVPAPPTTARPVSALPPKQSNGVSAPRARS